MSTFLTILILIASLLMIGVVLIQKSKGGGLASNFASSNQIMGVRNTTDVVEKATWTIAVIIMVLSIATVFFMPSHRAASDVEQSLIEIPTLPAAPATSGFETAPSAETPAEAPAETPAETPAQ